METWFTRGVYPWLGYAAAAALTVAMYLRVGVPAGGSEPAVALRSVPVIDVNAERGPAAPAVTTVGEFVLDFQAPIMEGRSYTATLLAAGKKVGPFPIRADDLAGNFHVAVARGVVNAGSWRLVVNESGGPGGEKGRDFGFEFTVR